MYQVYEWLTIIKAHHLIYSFNSGLLTGAHLCWMTQLDDDIMSITQPKSTLQISYSPQIPEMQLKLQCHLEYQQTELSTFLDILGIVAFSSKPQRCL